MPLTVDIGLPHVGKGMALVLERTAAGYAARFLPTPVMIYSCTSGRDLEAQELLMKAMMSGGFAEVRSLRRDLHAPAPACWLHHAEFCLSR